MKILAFLPLAMILLMLAGYCYKKGWDELTASKAPEIHGRGSPEQTRRVSLAPLTTSAQAGVASASVETLSCPACGGRVQETDRQCPYCGSTLVAAPSREPEAPRPLKLDWVKLGDRIQVRDPVRGETAAQVKGQIAYEELWQETRGGPWVPTGNIFAGFWLETSCFLLNWQNRFYLLDERLAVSDADIQRDFAAHARRFGQSDQTATVIFDYPPDRWRIDDIGKFRVISVEGEGIEFRAGAIGRFIHASREGERALVVEDYESGGGGQDTVWKGYQIQEKDVQKPS